MTPSASAPSIPSGEHVHLRLPHVGLLPATVSAVEPGAIMLVLTIKDSRVSRLVGGEAAVEYKTGRGIHSFGGILQLDDRSPDYLRVVTLGEAQRIQRRDWARVDAILPITVQGVDDEELGGETTTLNISGGGVLVSDKWEMPLGTDVRIELRADKGPPIRAMGRVVRAAGKDEKGIRIDSIAREDEERLVRLVRERERVALRMARGR